MSCRVRQGLASLETVGNVGRWHLSSDLPPILCFRCRSDRLWVCFPGCFPGACCPALCSIHLRETVASNLRVRYRALRRDRVHFQGAHSAAYENGVPQNQGVRKRLAVDLVSCMRLFCALFACAYCSRDPRPSLNLQPHVERGQRPPAVTTTAYFFPPPLRTSKAPATSPG